MTRRITNILIILTAFYCSDISGQSNKAVYYKIEIKNWGLLFTGNTNWLISSDSISFSRQNFNGEFESFAKYVSNAENESIVNYLKKINLSSINKNNVDNSAPDGMGEFDFKIIIDTTENEFHIYQIKIDELFNLVQQINKFLPEKYHIGYDDTYFRFKK